MPAPQGAFGQGLPLLRAQAPIVGAEDPRYNRDGTVRNEELQPPTVNAVNAATTGFLTKFIDQIRANCGRLGPEYRVNCLAVEFRSLSDRMPAQGDYADAKRALDRVAKELESLTRRARDRRKPRVSFQVTRPNAPLPEVTQEIAAVRARDQADIAVKATQAIQQGVLLLRSAPAGDSRQVHYTRVADALGGTAVLLRS